MLRLTIILLGFLLLPVSIAAAPDDIRALNGELGPEALSVVSNSGISGRVGIELQVHAQRRRSRCTGHGEELHEKLVIESFNVSESLKSYCVKILQEEVESGGDKKAG